MNLSPNAYRRAPRPQGLFRALRHRNYRLFFAGQGISLVGNWMTTTATYWLVYRMTGDVRLLGLVAFANQIPGVLVTPIAGVLVERWNRRRVLVATQVFAMIQSLALAALALSGAIREWHILVLAVFQGLVNGFDIPARQAFVLDMVESKQDLGNAIALNSSLFNGSRLIGPVIAGAIIARLGEGLCFLIDGVSYIAVIASLLAMRIHQATPQAPSGRVWHGLKEGFIYAHRFLPVRAILLLVCVMSFAGMPYFTLLPVLASDVLHGDSNTYGRLLGAVGLGALGGAVYLASHPGVLRFGRKIPIAACIFGTGLIGLSQSTLLWLSYPMLLLTGAGMMVTMASCNTVIQTIADDTKRGRVISLYTLAFIGMMPAGNLVYGQIAKLIGAPATILLGGAVCVTAGLAFYRQVPRLRLIVSPIYAKLDLPLT